MEFEDEEEREVFDPSLKAKDILKDRKTAYQLTFALDSVHAKAVMKDLAKFCRANKSTFHIDNRMHALLEGRREVFLRIAQHLNLTPEELYSILG